MQNIFDFSQALPFSLPILKDYFSFQQQVCFDIALLFSRNKNLQQLIHYYYFRLITFREEKRNFRLEETLGSQFQVISEEIS